MLIRVETPGGYLVWADRTHFKMVDGPKVEKDADPNPLRKAAAMLRQYADEIEASIS